MTDYSIFPDGFLPPVYPVGVAGKHCEAFFTARILNWAYYPYEDKAILEKLKETSTYNPINGGVVSMGEGERITTKISTGAQKIESLNYSEGQVSYTGTAYTGDPYRVQRTRYNRAYAMNVYGLEENIYNYVNAVMNYSISSDTTNQIFGSKKLNQLFFVLSGGDCYNPPVTEVPIYIYLGTAAPPPPPPKNKNMDCCDCNTIATILEDKIINALKPQVENLKDHIDQRSKELTVIHQKQLEAMELDLKPIIKRLNEVEANLWNGILK